MILRPMFLLPFLSISLASAQDAPAPDSHATYADAGYATLLDGAWGSMPHFPLGFTIGDHGISWRGCIANSYHVIRDQVITGRAVPGSPDHAAGGYRDIAIQIRFTPSCDLYPYDRFRIIRFVFAADTPCEAHIHLYGSEEEFERNLDALPQDNKRTVNRSCKARQHP
ncbi:MAG TPA: hypothetical protein VIU46_05765 [Gallionellaceae bacterium]